MPYLLPRQYYEDPRKIHRPKQLLIFIDYLCFFLFYVLVLNFVLFAHFVFYIVVKFG